MKNVITIKNRRVGDGFPAYIIAEMSANHAGSIERAKEIIHAAKESGADCIKIQTYTPDTMTIDCHNDYFFVKNGTWEGENLYSLYGKACTPWEWQAELKTEADSIGIDFFSTPFDMTSVDFLEDIGVEFYKIASFELVDIPLIEYVASKGKPMIMSTGMGSLEEIKDALRAIRRQGNDELALLKCSSAYPAISDDMNLKTIADMKEKFNIPIGLSDHSMGSLGAAAAVSMGANIIEKHFCISREIENPDASFSMTPSEFKQMVADVRSVEAAIGHVCYGVSKQEESSMVFRRSVFITKDMQKGDFFTKENTGIIRPGYGMKPKYQSDILGMKAICDIQRGTPCTFAQAEKGKILFLTNNENTEDLYRWLLEKEGKQNVYKFTNRLTLDIVKQLEPAYVISFNYIYVLPIEVISYMDNKIINLHTSYLPYNKGFSPNFFSFLDHTKKGVTIHRMSEELDQGDILCRKELFFDEEKETFASTYETLNREIKTLFYDNWSDIKHENIQPIKQEEGGTYHTYRELLAHQKNTPFAWDDTIAAFKKKYDLY